MVQHIGKEGLLQAGKARLERLGQDVDLKWQAAANQYAKGRMLLGDLDQAVAMLQQAQISDQEIDGSARGREGIERFIHRETGDHPVAHAIEIEFHEPQEWLLVIDQEDSAIRFHCLGNRALLAAV